MSRLPILILSLLFASHALAAPTWFWRAEGTTLSAPNDLPADAGTVTLNSAASISATAVLVGSNGLWANGSAHHAQIDSTTTVFDTGEGVIGFLFRATAWAGGTAIVTVGTGGANQYGIKMQGSSGSGNMTFYAGDPEGANVEATTTIGNLTQGVTYGVIGRWNHATSTLRIEVYSTPTGTPALIQGVSNTSGYTEPASLATSSGFRIGDTAGLGFTGYFDNVFVSKTYAEPIESNFSITSYTSYGGGGGNTGIILKRRKH